MIWGVRVVLFVVGLYWLWSAIDMIRNGVAKVFPTRTERLAPSAAEISRRSDPWLYWITIIFSHLVPALALILYSLFRD